MGNVICYNSIGTTLECFEQWDTNQELIVGGVEFSSAPVFYFSNTLYKQKHPVQSELCDIGASAIVPDVLLQYAVPLIVTFEVSSLEYEIRIHVSPAQMPGGYDYDDSIDGDSGNSGSGTGGSGSSGSDIVVSVKVVDNLTTSNSTAALSAAQGVVLKGLIDTLDAEKMNISELSTAVDKEISDAIESGELVGVKGDEGRGIISVDRTAGDGSPGTVDEYTILYSDDTTSTFTVYNGSDGRDSNVYVAQDTAPEDTSLLWVDTSDNTEDPGSGGDIDLTGYATEQYVKEYAQPKGNYLTEVPEGYAKTEDIPKNVVKSVNGVTPDTNGNVELIRDEISVDDEINNSSTNPIQNKAVYEAIDALDNKIEGHSHSEYENQNSYSSVNVNGNVILANSPEDTISINSGENITVDIQSGSIVISANADQIFTQDDAPLGAEDGDLWVDMDDSVVINAEHIEIDQSLSVEGMAADAKVTGEEISKLSLMIGDTSVSNQIAAAIDLLRIEILGGEW